MVFKLIPSRFKIGFLGMTACSLLYALRVNLNVAIVAMVNQPRNLSEGHPLDGCSNDNSDNQDQSNDFPSSIKFDWSESVQGFILSAYFYGYTATQITGGLLTDKWGAKWVCGLGICIPAVVNALSPLAAQRDYIWLIVIRVIIGGFHGLVHSSLFSMYAKWFPIQERTTAIAATQFGGNIGAVFMSPISGYLAELEFAGGWPSIFYFSSLIHILWLLMWWCSAHDSPSECNSICPEEHLYILQNINSNTIKRKSSVPWKSILASRAVYASILAKTSGTFGYYVLATSVPSYFQSIFNLKISENSIYTALMYLAIGITLMSAGPFSNVVILKTRLTRTTVRKIFQTVALVGPAICLLILPSIGCSLVGDIVLIVCCMCLYGFITGGEYPIIPEYAPEFTGTVFGFANTLASSMGFLAPIIVGQILDSRTDETRGTRQKWNSVFYTTAVFYLVGALFFCIFGSAERQTWAKIGETTQDLEMHEIDAKRPYIQHKTRRKSESKIQSHSFISTGRKLSRYRLTRSKPINTQTPEWIRFKRNSLVY